MKFKQTCLKFMMALATAMVFIFPSSLVLAQDQAKLQAQLQKAMAGEPALADQDIKIYVDNLEAIFQLGQNPAKSRVLIKSTGWSENRFSYVTTKMSIGMAQLSQPDDPKLAAVPDFAKPTPDELKLIDNQRDAIVKRIVDIQKKQAGS